MANYNTTTLLQKITVNTNQIEDNNSRITTLETIKTDILNSIQTLSTDVTNLQTQITTDINQLLTDLGIINNKDNSITSNDLTLTIEDNLILNGNNIVETTAGGYTNKYLRVKINNQFYKIQLLSDS